MRFTLQGHSSGTHIFLSGQMGFKNKWTYSGVICILVQSLDPTTVPLVGTSYLHCRKWELLKPHFLCNLSDGFQWHLSCQGVNMWPCVKPTLWSDPINWYKISLIPWAYAPSGPGGRVNLGQWMALKKPPTLRTGAPIKILTASRWEHFLIGIIM